VHDDDAVGRGPDVQLQVAEALVDRAPESGNGVLQTGQVPDVPAAVGVGPRVRAGEVGMLLQGCDDIECGSRR
jgi:hypothetical protein